MERGDLPNYSGPELTREELLRNYQDKGDRFVKEEIRTLEDERRVCTAIRFTKTLLNTSGLCEEGSGQCLNR